jgi:hypothetical protein
MTQQPRIHQEHDDKRSMARMSATTGDATTPQRRSARRTRPTRRRQARFSRGLAARADRVVFSRVLERLQVLLPPKSPVVVHAGRVMTRAHGTCARRDGVFRICVCSALDEAFAIDVLLHEWAHALSWNAELDRAARKRSLSDLEFEGLCHGPEWGLAYGIVYRTYVCEIVPQIRAEDLNPFRAAALRKHRQRSRRGRLSRLRTGS